MRIENFPLERTFVALCGHLCMATAHKDGITNERVIALVKFINLNLRECCDCHPQPRCAMHGGV